MAINNHKFSPRDYLKFIQLYENHKCLWNVQDCDYKNRKKRDKAYEDIKVKMNLEDINMVKKKIKIIRDTYNIEKEKIIKSSIEGLPNEIYKPRIPWFDAIDSFIYQFSCKRKTKSGTNIKKESSEHSKKMITLSEDEKFCENSEDIFDIQEPEIIPVIKRKKSNLSPSSDMNINNKHVEELNTISLSSKNIYDEFYYFAMNLAEQLRQLPLKNALVTQNKIQQIIAKERIHCDFLINSKILHF